MKFKVLLALAAALTSGPLPGQDAGDLRAKSEAARQAMTAGEYAKAVELYGALVKALPELPGPRMNLGIALYMAGRYSDAVGELKSVADREPKMEPALLFLAASHLRLDQAESAIAPLRDYLKKRPEDPRGLQMLADALLSTHRYPEASARFRSLVSLEPANPRHWNALGRCYEALARRAFTELERTAPESAYTAALLADSRFSLQQYQSAYFLYRQALEKAPVPGLHVAIAQIYRRTGHPDWAETEQLKEIERGPPDCRREEWVCAFLEGRFLEAAQAAAELKSPEGLYWQSKAYDQLALASFSRLAQLPPSYELHRVTAEAHRSAGRHQQAAAEWRKALELKPDDPYASGELAAALYLSRDYDAAQPLVAKLLKQDPDSAQFNYLAGAILLQKQQAEAAVPLLEKAVAADPDPPAAHASLGRALLDIGQAERAVPHLRAALEGDEDGSVHYQLSRALMGVGDRAAARDVLAKYQAIQKSRERERARLEEEFAITPP